MILVVVIQLQSQQFWIWAGIISVSLGCGLDSQETMLQYLERGTKFSFSPKHQFWGPPSILFSGYSGLFIGLGGGEGPFTVSSIEV